MSKLITFDLEASKKIKSGVDQLAEAVKTTLGPGGRSVVVGKKFGAPHITKDGVTVAKEIELTNPIENAGAQLIKEVASKTNDDAGDGTTTATVLAQAIFTEGIKNITAGANATELVVGMKKGVDAAKEYIRKKAKAITTSEEIEQIATISANNDKTIGIMIAGAMKQVGNKGVITVEEAKGTETEVTIVEGMQFDRGYHSPHFVTDREKMTVELDDPYILITDKKITNFQSIVKILEGVAKKSKTLLIIAEDIENEPTAFLAYNAIRSALKVCAVKAPGFGDHRKAQLEDLATLTGATVISEERGYTLENTTLEHLGSAKKVKVDKENTTLVDGRGEKNKINAKIKEIELQIQQATSDYDKEKLQERLGKLSNGVAVLHVGASTEVEMKEKKDRVTDALNATRAAVEEGILSGGGTALCYASKDLDKVTTDNEDQKIGVKIIQKALKAPLYTLLSNALGSDRVYPIMHKIQESTDNYGYNVRTHTFVDMISDGVIDPAKVEISSLDNAYSIVSLLLRTGCVIVDDPKENEKSTTPAMPGAGGGMPGMM